MQWHVNDISLTGQFEDSNAFYDKLKPILSARNTYELVRSHLYCSRQLHARPVVGRLTFREAIQQAPNRDFVRQVLIWLTQSGPFWDDERESNPDDYFEFLGNDVTEQGLGEAARRRIAGTEARSFSFRGSHPSCEHSPLMVQHGLTEAPIGRVEVPNVWDLGELIAIARETVPPPRNWLEVLARLRARFDRVFFADSVERALFQCPYSAYIIERLEVLLSILQEYMESRGADGLRTARSQEIIREYFTGGKSLFSDESQSNKAAFSTEMTFVDPNDPDRSIFCTWHGKIKNPQIRVHFEWPVPKEQRVVRVFYIGPKITKA